jgi:hypothetical protein
MVIHYYVAKEWRWCWKWSTPTLLQVGCDLLSSLSRLVLVVVVSLLHTVVCVVNEEDWFVLLSCERLCS